MKKLTLAIFGALLAGSTSVYAADAHHAEQADKMVGDAAAGKTKSVTCAACHGTDGNSTIAMYPKIAGQHASYTAIQLQRFKDGGRQDPSMSPMAMPLSEQDMLDLAAYFATQTVTLEASDESLVALGQQLYKGGDKASGIPACIACHGPQGKGNPPAKYPSVSGQHAQYTAKQLQDYKSGARGGDKPSSHEVIMREIAVKMSEAQINAVAAYTAGLH